MSRQKSITIIAVVTAAVISAGAFVMLSRLNTKIDTNSSAAVREDNSSQIRNIFYNVKFECGTISGGEGPLRPGHYDTDIGIFNKQDFSVKVQWSANANDGRNTNSILRTLQPQAATSIVCKDLQGILGSEESFAEGFVIINVPVDPGLLGSLSNGSMVLGRSQDFNILEVQAFYTANALAELPHNTLVDKITFTIINDTSGKIPPGIIGKVLDTTMPSAMNEISETQEKVKGALADKYGLSKQELEGLQIEIKNVSVGVGTMIDDHAISMLKIVPQAS